MQLQELLFTQGFGTRRICAGLIQRGLVSIYAPHSLQDVPWRGAWYTPTESNLEVMAEGLQFKVTGITDLSAQTWHYVQHAYLVLHKPAGYECSHKPSAWPSIYSLLPTPLRQRPQKSSLQGVQAIGRLDQDTTGLLILTDDGAFIHRLSSPKHHAPKFYDIVAKHPIDAKQIDRLLAGVVLEDSPQPVRAAACKPMGTHHLRLTLTQGKYHQVKRMMAAVGNRVESLHRCQIGTFRLPADLHEGQWRWLTPLELSQLSQVSATDC